jgi:hypothetical protein
LEDNIKIDRREIYCIPERVEFIYLAVGRTAGYCCENCNVLSSFIEVGEFLGQLSDYWLLKNFPVPHSSLSFLSFCPFLPFLRVSFLVSRFFSGIEFRMLKAQYPHKHVNER